MSDSSASSGIISPANLNTIVAISFILGVLAVGLNVWNFSRTNQVDARVRMVENATLLRDKKLKKEMAVDTSEDPKIAALEEKIAALEAKLAAPPVAEADPEDEAPADE